MSQTNKASNDSTVEDNIQPSKDNALSADGSSQQEDELKGEEQVPGIICELCGVKSLSGQTIQTHFDGIKHKKKFKRYQTMKSLAKEFGIFVDDPDDNNDKKLTFPRLAFLEKQVAKLLYCTTCNISVTGFENMLMHLGTTRHHQAVLAANGYKPPPVVEPTKKKGQLPSKPQPKKKNNQESSYQADPSSTVSQTKNSPPNPVTNPGNTGSKSNGSSRQKQGRQFPQHGFGRGRGQGRGRGGRGRGMPSGMHAIRSNANERFSESSFPQNNWYNATSAKLDLSGSAYMSHEMPQYESTNPMNTFGGYAAEDNYSFNQQMFYEQDSSKFTYSSGFPSNTMQENFGMSQQSSRKRHGVDDPSYTILPKRSSYFNPSQQQQYSMDYNHGQFSSYTGMY